MLRKLVTGLANLAGYLAAFFLAAIAVATLTQIVARQLGYAIETTELSGFFLAASTFLGLGYTLINGGHVRVSLVSQFAPERIRWLIEIGVCLVAIVVVGFAAWHMAAFAAETYRFGELSPGLLAVPMWIPQSSVALGLIVLLLAIIEQAVLVLTGRTPGYLTNVDSTGE